MELRHLRHFVRRAHRVARKSHLRDPHDLQFDGTPVSGLSSVDYGRRGGFRLPPARSEFSR
jgi:hypothetical protein